MSNVTPNDQPIEPKQDGAGEGVTVNTVDPAVQATEIAKQQEKADEAISIQDFQRQLETPSEAKPQTNADASARAAHESNMLLAAARVAKLAKKDDLTKEEAAVELLDSGLISQDQANYLLKNSYEVKQSSSPQAPNQTFNKNELKAEMRAEEKLMSVVGASKLTAVQAQNLINDYRNLSNGNTPENAAEFALYRAGLSTKQASDEAYRQGANQAMSARNTVGTSPSTPEPKKTGTMASNLDEYEVQRAQELKELQDLQNQGLA